MKEKTHFVIWASRHGLPYEAACGRQLDTVENPHLVTRYAEDVTCITCLNKLIADARKSKEKASQNLFELKMMKGKLQ